MYPSLNPFLRYASRIRFGKRDGKPRIGEDCRIFYGHKGSCGIIVGKRYYLLNEGDILYLPAYTRYHLDPKSNPWSYMIDFNFDLTETQSHYETPIPPKTNDNEPFVLKHPVLFPPFNTEFFLSNKNDLEPLLLETVAKFKMKEKYYRDFCSANLKRILVEIAIELEETRLYSIPIQNAQKYISLHYAESLSNEEIAQSIGYNPCYLSKLFKVETGMTLHQAVIDHRLKISREMLLLTNKSISDIAAECGFSNSSHFGQVFRSAFGQTPKDYRDRNR